MKLQHAKYTLENLGKINVVLGKNGTGKSTMLRAFDGYLRQQGFVQYITPERGGELTLEGGIETQIQDSNWLSNARRSNQANTFRQASVSQFKRLETLALREIEKKPEIRANMAITFDTTVSKVNALLDNVEIYRADNAAFRVRSKGGGDREPRSLSSGESELISLAIEILTYSYVTRGDQYKDKNNWLLVDEPDVHLHPDLQYRLMKLLVEASAGGGFSTIISTHSTSIVGALCDLGRAKVALMKAGQNHLVFEEPSIAFQRVLPIFGAHPLSNVFNSNPILLVEGEDDERIWQAATRSSNNKIKLWPCAAGDVQSLNEYEGKARVIIEAVYDAGVGFSIRDRDGTAGEIEDVGPIRRAKLNCRAAENLLLSDQALSVMNVTWGELQRRFEDWLQTNTQHPRFSEMQAFRDGGWNRKDADVKELRNLIVGLAGVSRPWEVIVGQAIAWLKRDGGPGESSSLRDFLGAKIVQMLDLAPNS